MKRSLAIYVASLLLFGMNGIIAANIELQSAQIVFLRSFIGGVLVLLVSLVVGRRVPLCRDARQWAFTALSGACLGLAWVALFQAYRLVGVGIASLEYYCAPVVVMLLSVPLFKERFTVLKWLGFAAVLAGTVLVGSQSLGSGESLWGLACGALSAVGLTGMVVFSKLTHDVSGLHSSAAQLLVASAVAGAFVAATDGLGFVASVPAASVPWILLLGLVNTGVGCLLYFTAIIKLPAQTVATLGYLEPLSAVLFSAFLLGEQMSALQWLGAALIIGGACVTEIPVDCGPACVLRRMRARRGDHSGAATYTS